MRNAIHKLSLVLTFLAALALMAAAPANAQNPNVYGIAIGDSMTVEISNIWEDQWLFEGQVGQNVLVIIDADFDVFLELYRPDSHLLLQNNNVLPTIEQYAQYDADASLGAVQLPQTGQYFLRLTGSAMFDVGQYTITITETDAPDYVELAPDAPVSGELAPGETAMWTYNAPIGKVTFNVSTDLDAYIVEVFDPFENILVPGTRETPIEFDTLYNGVYVFALTSQSAAPGQYEVGLGAGMSDQQADEAALRAECEAGYATLTETGFSWEGAPADENTLATLTQALEVNPDDALVYVERARAYLSMGDHERALLDAGQAFDLNPDLPEVYTTLGGVLAAMGNRRQALANFDRALELLPDDANLYNDRGYANLLIFDPPTAIADFRRSLELQQTVRALNNRGSVYHTIGLCEVALEDWAKAADVAQGMSVSLDEMLVILGEPSAAPTPAPAAGGDGSAGGSPVDECIITVAAGTEVKIFPNVNAMVQWDVLNQRDVTIDANTDTFSIGRFVDLEGNTWWKLKTGGWVLDAGVTPEPGCETLRDATP